MSDKAHRLTDEKLEEMEKRLSAIYSRAEKEIQKTADGGGYGMTKALISAGAAVAE